MVEVLLLSVVVVSAALAVLTKELFASVISLAVMSTGLGGLFYYLGLSHAGAFELSAGAGLTTVMFVSILSMITKPRAEGASVKDPFSWTHAVGAVITLALVIILGFALRGSVPSYLPRNSGEVGFVLWNLRSPDILALGLAVLAGALGIGAMFHQERGNRRV